MADTVSRLAIQVGMDTNGLKTGAARENLFFQPCQPVYPLRLTRFNLSDRH